jgi:hypothetical protein
MHAQSQKGTKIFRFFPPNRARASATRIWNRQSIDPLTIRYYCLFMATLSQIQKNLRAAMKDALRIQERFVPEPIFAKTGQGYLKSEGTTTVRKIKDNIRRRRSAKA